jgi:hypothetical protein
MIIEVVLSPREYYIVSGYVISVTYRLKNDFDSAGVGSFDLPTVYKTREDAAAAAAGINFRAIVAANMAAEAAKILNNVRHTVEAKVEVK